MRDYVALSAAVAVTLSVLPGLTGCNAPEENAVADNPALTAPVPEGMVRGTVL